MPVSPASIDLARRLLAVESGRGSRAAGGASEGGIAESAGGSAIPLVRVCVKLRTIVGGLAGTTGFRTLLARALTLARAQEASLAGVRVLEDGSLSGIDEDSAAAGTSAGEALLAQVVDLLIIFIGLALLLQLLRGEWPDVSSGRSGGKRET